MQFFLIQGKSCAVIFFLLLLTKSFIGACNAFSPTVNYNLSHLVLTIASELNVKHLILVGPSGHESDELSKIAWLKGVTTEMHTEPRKWITTRERKNNMRTAKKSLFPGFDWKFLENRKKIFRHQMAVLVVGPAVWSFPVVLQLLSNGVIGSLDTLLFAPTGKVNETALCEILPLTVRVALLEVSSPVKKTHCERVIKEGRLLEKVRCTFKRIGCWRRNGDGGTLDMAESLFSPVTSLKGAVLRAAVVQGFNEVIPVYENAIHMDSKNDGKIESNNKIDYRKKLIRLEGLLGELIEKIRRNLRFDVEFITVQGFGVRSKNGSFNGVLGMAQRREVDFAAASLSLLSERAEAVDFGDWFGLHNTRFLTRVPQQLDGKFLLFQIFKWQVWTSILGFLTLSTATLSLIWGAEGIILTRSTEESSWLPLGLTSVTTIMKTAVFMSSRQIPRHSSGRLILVSCWLVMLILVSVYRSNLTAFLSIPTVSNPPTSIEELLNMGYKLSISRGYSQYHKMKTSPIEEHLEAFRQAEIRQDKSILPEEKYIVGVNTNDLALLVNVMAVPQVMEKYATTRGARKVCTLQMSSEKLFLEIGGLAFPKNSPIKHLFDQQINWIRATKTGHIPDAKCIPPRLENDQLRPLEFLKLGGLLTVWVTGVGISALLFIGEMIVGNRSE